MFGFLVVFAVAVAALLLVQEMDVENLRPRTPVAKRPVRYGEMKASFLTAENAAR